MKRRDFITFLGGVAAAWPLAVPAQQPERYIGMLNALGSDDPEAQARVAALQEELQKAGWIVGRNLQIDLRWTAANPEHIGILAAELMSLSPD